MTDVRVVFLFIGIPFSAFHQLLLVPHHFKIGVDDFFFGILPFQVYVGAGILGEFTAVSEMPMGLSGGKVCSGLFIGAGLLGFGG